MRDEFDGDVSSAEGAREARDDSNQLDSARQFLRVGFEERPFWAGLFENLRDVMFPARLPSLELTSAPVPMVDRMAGRTNPWAVGAATVMNAGLLALVILLGLRGTVGPLPLPPAGRDIQLKEFKLFAPASLNRGGGSGGDRSLMDAVMGRPPKQEAVAMAAPVRLLEHPTIAMDSAIAVPPDVKLPDNPLLPNLGVHSSPNVKLASGGPGRGGNFGNGSRGGDGPGDGGGDGPGSVRGAGDLVYRPGVGGVSRPVLVVSHDAEFSEEARRQRYQGVCIVSIIVDAHGLPVNPRVTRSLGMGLDEKAVEAVRNYRFKPAMKDGKAVASFVNVEVDFHMY